MKYIRTIDGLDWTIVADIHRRNEISIQKGKYLFFSKYRDELITLAKEIIRDFDLVLAKVSVDSRNGNYVLLVYDILSRYKYHLVKYGNQNVQYRYWKANLNEDKKDERIYI